MDCHGSPDGFDLAYWNISAADIRRRDADHINPADSEKIVGLMEELRKKYDIVPKDIRTVSPFQPGGSMLPGASALERDAALIASFQSALPLLATGNVNSATKANQAVNDILNFDINSHPIGIQLPKWSRDKHFGNAEGSITDWIADVAMLPKDQAAMNRYYDAQDVYLNNPSEANFWLMYDSFYQNTKVAPELTDPDGKTFQRHKYLASMIGAHDLRMETMGLPRILDKHSKHKIFYYDSAKGYRVFDGPIFELGEAGNADENFGFPQHVIDSLNPAINIKGDIERGKDPWWWIGWMYNPGLVNNTTRQEYFPNSLIRGNFQFDPLGGSMVSHAKYMTTFTDVYNYRTPDPANASTRIYYWMFSGNKLAPFNPNPSVFAAIPYDPDQDGGKFFNTQHKAAHVKFSVNVAKMRLYMIKEDVTKALANGHSYWAIQSGLENIVNEAMGSHDFIETQRQLAQYDPANSAHNEALYKQVRDLMRDLKNGSTTPVVGTGTGLKATIFSSLRLENPVASRVDSQIHFQPGVGGASGAVYPASDISARWTGYLQPRYTDEYRFNVLFPGERNDLGGVRIWVDDILVYDKWDTVGKYTHKSLPVALTAGQQHRFRVEYRQKGAFQQISVRWESSKELNDVIPKSQLYPADLPVEMAGGVLSPSADAHVQDGSDAGVNFGTRSGLQVKQSSNVGYNRVAFLRFPLGALTSDPEYAELSLINSYVPDNITERPSEIKLYRAANSNWTETNLTWNNQPARGALIGSATVYREGQDVRFILTSALAAARAAGEDLTLMIVQPSGNQLLEFESLESGDSGPVILFESSATTGTSIEIEAESFIAKSGVSLSSTNSGYLGSGYLDYGGNSSWAEWETPSGPSGPTSLTIRYANASSSIRRCEVMVDGTAVGTVDFPNTGSWSSWSSVSLPIGLSPGTHRIRLRAITSSGGPNVDWLEIR